MRIGCICYKKWLWVFDIVESQSKGRYFQRQLRGHAVDSGFNRHRDEGPLSGSELQLTLCTFVSRARRCPVLEAGESWLCIY